MNTLDALILGIVQGITEFLPISSSGHLVLVESLLGLEVANLKDFDVIVHVGTLLAILLYFWRDIWNKKYWPYVIVGTIPAVIVGLTLEGAIDSVFRSASAVGAVMLLIGVIFLTPESWGKKPKNKKLTYVRAISIGLAQALAIIPGISRSGSTIFTGSFLGLEREEAARFSFLLGSVAIAGAGLLTAKDLSSISLAPEVLLTGFISSFVAGYYAVKWLMHYLQKHPLYVFGVYLTIVGASTLLFF